MANHTRVGTDRLQERISILEEQVADLARLLEVNGMTLIKCDFCGEVINGRLIFVADNQLMGVSGLGVSGVALKDGKERRYYCVDHLPEALEDCADWGELDRERAEYTIAGWLLRYVYKLTPGRVKCLIDFPAIKDKAEILKQDQLPLDRLAKVW